MKLKLRGNSKRQEDIMTEYNYNLIANFNVNIRVERHRVISTPFGEEIKMLNIPYSQARLSKSDMEDIIERSNSIAENVTLYYKEDSGKQTLTEEQVNITREAITEAVSTLIDNLTNEEWISNNVRELHKADPSNRMTGLNSYIHTYQEDDYETKVFLTYMPNVLSATLIYPNRPGALVNNFNEMEY